MIMRIASFALMFEAMVVSLVMLPAYCTDTNDYDAHHTVSPPQSSTDRLHQLVYHDTPAYCAEMHGLCAKAALAAQRQRLHSTRTSKRTDRLTPRLQEMKALARTFGKGPGKELNRALYHFLSKDRNNPLAKDTGIAYQDQTTARMVGTSYAPTLQSSHNELAYQHRENMAKKQHFDEKVKAYHRQKKQASGESSKSMRRGRWRL